eukprot:jgi/Chlat1/1729/Chrsp13S02162
MAWPTGPGGSSLHKSISMIMEEHQERIAAPQQATSTSGNTLRRDSYTGSGSYVRETTSESAGVVVKEFHDWMLQPELAVAVAAIKALTAAIRRSSASTMMGLEIELKEAAEALKRCDPTSISLAAGCELFIRYVTRESTLEYADLATCKQHLIERGEMFAETSLKARETIATLGEHFIRDGNTVLIHGFSRCVLAMLLRAANHGTHFSVICTEGRPDNAGIRSALFLGNAGIPVTLILDSAVAFIMDKVDLVLVGAEGVVENGGVINKLGTYQMAIAAHVLHRPFYFARLYPLNQRDLPVETKPVYFGNKLPPGVDVENPSRDYTPPNFITLLFTDLGVLTPSAVSDELIQLYL